MPLRSLPTAILTSLCLLAALTKVVYAEDAALQKAKSAIQAYFHAILNGDSTLAPNMAMATAIQDIPDKDQADLQDYYDRTSLSAARQAVDAYAQKVSSGQDASDAADRMHEMEDALSPENLQKIKLYYNQKKLATDSPASQHP